MKISIIILTYNRSTCLKSLLLSLQELRYEPLEIVVVDNHSEDDTEELIYQEFSNIDYIRTDENIGVSARNLGLKKATGDIVITLDDDIFGMNDDDIDILIELFDNYQDIGAVCFKVVDFYTGKLCDWCHPFKIEEYSHKRFITDDISEGAVAFRRSVFEITGFYPDDFFISYEGADLLCRMVAAGFKTVYEPMITVHHKHAENGRSNWRRYYYDTRNQIWFVARNYPLLMGLRYLIRGLTAMLIYSMRDGFMQYWVKGLWDGVRLLPQVLADRKCITKETIKNLQDIARNKPGFAYMIRKRIFQRGIQI